MMREGKEMPPEVRELVRSMKKEKGGVRQALAPIP
jgi:hypothetical protein